MKKIKIGHIGWLAQDESSECETVAWCDIDSDRLQAAGAANPKITLYTDYREMVKHPGLDAVVISTPNFCHAEQAIAFLEAGKDVFLEKPMGINRAESDAILAAAKRSGRTCVIDFEMRASLYANRVQELITSGEYGELKRMEFIHYRGSWLQEGNGLWRVQRDRSGGLYFMEPIHEVDIFRFFGGDIRAVQSTAAPSVLPQYDFEDHVCSHFFFESGVLGTILTSHTHSAHTNDSEKWEDWGHHMRMVLTLSGGSIEVDFLKNRILINRYEAYPNESSGGLRVVFDRIEDFTDQAAAFHHDIHRMRRDFIHRLAHGKPPIQDITDAWKTHRVCLAAEQSLDEGFRQVEVDYTTA